MTVLDTMTPLHDRILVKHVEQKAGPIEVIRENPLLLDMIGQGDNGEHDDNRRVFVISRVLSVGNEVLGVKKGDVIVHTAWDDLPDWAKEPGYAVIRENDVAGHLNKYGHRA